MKRVLSVLTVLAALAGTASAAGYVLPPYQAGALKSSDWMPSYNVEGLYAIGDIRSKEVFQIANAVGEGAEVAHYIQEYLKGSKSER